MATAHWQAKAAAVGSAVKTPVAIIVAAQARCKRPWRGWIRILGLPGGVVGATVIATARPRPGRAEWPKKEVAKVSMVAFGTGRSPALHGR
jgi:hypothetical protein